MAHKPEPEAKKIYRVLVDGVLILEVDRAKDKWSMPKKGDLVALSPEAASHFIREGYVDSEPVDEPASAPRIQRVHLGAIE